MKRVLGKLLILISLSPIGCVTQEVRNDSPQATPMTTTVHGKSAREDMLSEEEIELRAKLNNQLSHYQYVGQPRPRMTANNLSLVASNSEANWVAHSNSEDTIWSRRFRGVKNIEIKQMKIIPGFK